LARIDSKSFRPLIAQIHQQVIDGKLFFYHEAIPGLNEVDIRGLLRGIDDLNQRPPTKLIAKRHIRGHLDDIEAKKQ
jgi:hypothetical protein